MIDEITNSEGVLVFRLRLLCIWFVIGNRGSRPWRVCDCMASLTRNGVPMLRTGDETTVSHDKRSTLVVPLTATVVSSIREATS